MVDSPYPLLGCGRFSQDGYAISTNPVANGIPRGNLQRKVECFGEQSKNGGNGATTDSHPQGHAQGNHGSTELMALQEGPIEWRRLGLDAATERRPLGLFQFAAELPLFFPEFSEALPLLADRLPRPNRRGLPSIPFFPRTFGKTGEKAS